MQQSPATMAQVLDALARGDTVAQAGATCGLSESAIWTWKAKSRAAFNDFDFSKFYLTWNGHVDFFHVLMPMAIKQRRSELRSHSPFPPPLSAMEKELREKAPMTPLKQDLLDRAKAHLSDPNRITRPVGVVHIERDSADDAARERINAPSDQTGLPIRKADEPRSAQPPPVDYSRRRAQVTRVDTAGIGRGTVPPGGFRVR